MYIWTWKTDVVTEEYKNMVGYQNFKRGKKLKTGNDISETNTMIMMEELGLQDKEETEGYSDFENQFQQGRWILETKKQFFQDGTQLKSANYSDVTSMLLLGYKNGVFGLYRIEGLETINLQIFSCTDKKISHLAFNYTSNLELKKTTGWL